MPARPTTFRWVATSSSSFVTLVLERIARPSSLAPMMLAQFRGRQAGFLHRRRSHACAKDIDSFGGKLVGDKYLGHRDLLRGQTCMNSASTWRGRPIEPGQKGLDVGWFPRWRRPRCAEPGGCVAVGARYPAPRPPFPAGWRFSWRLCACWSRIRAPRTRGRRWCRQMDVLERYGTAGRRGSRPSRFSLPICADGGEIGFGAGDQARQAADAFGPGAGHPGHLPRTAC